MARLIVEQGDKYLEWQFQAALAADQRATTSASIFIGFSAALFVGVITYWADQKDCAVLLGGLLTAALLFFGAGCCFWAALPRDFYSPGNEPARWFGVVDQKISVALGREATNYQTRIDVNDRALGKMAQWFKWGTIVACIAPIAGAIVWIVFSF